MFFDFFDLMFFFFLLTLGQTIMMLFESRIWEKCFHGEYFDAEIIYFDSVTVARKDVDVTVVNYMCNGKSRDVMLRKKGGEKIGDIINIITDGKVAYRTKRDWRDIINKEVIGNTILMIFSGYVTINHIGEVSFGWIIFCVIFLIIVWVKMYWWT